MKKNEREKKLRELIKEKPELEQLLDEMLFLEGRLTELKKLPFIKVNPNNPNQQKATPAQKQYKELLQQYANLVKIIGRITEADGDNIDCLLGEYLKRVNQRT